MNLIPLSVTGVAGNVITEFEVPENSGYRLLFGHSILVTDATVTDRRWKIEVTNSSNSVFTDSHAGVIQTAGLTRQYSLKPGIFRETSFIDDDIEVPLANSTILLPGWKIRIIVANGVAGDTYSVNLGVSKASVSAFQS